MQTLAIFDLDDTLTLQDTESLWQEYLVRKGLLTPKTVSYHIALFKKYYNEGSLDIQSVVDFSMGPLNMMTYEKQKEYQEDFASSVLPAYIAPEAKELVCKHRSLGHTVIIISAGHEFIIKPAASFFDVDATLCTLLKRKPCGAFSSDINGKALFQAEKITALEQWLTENKKSFDLMYFYTDSINDLPLLERADVPITVNPCDRLRAIALQRQWPIIDIKKEREKEVNHVSPANSSA